MKRSYLFNAAVQLIAPVLAIYFSVMLQKDSWQIFAPSSTWDRNFQFVSIQFQFAFIQCVENNFAQKRRFRKFDLDFAPRNRFPNHLIMCFVFVGSFNVKFMLLPYFLFILFLFQKKTTTNQTGRTAVSFIQWCTNVGEFIYYTTFDL